MDDRTIKDRREREGRCQNCGQMLFDKDDHHLYTTVGGFILVMTAGALVGAVLTLGLITLLDWLIPPGIVV